MWCLVTAPATVTLTVGPPPKLSERHAEEDSSGQVRGVLAKGIMVFVGCLEGFPGGQDGRLPVKRNFRQE